MNARVREGFYLLVQDLRLFDDEYLFKYFRMSATQYEEIQSMVAPLIQKSCRKRECIGHQQRLSDTLRYLAMQDSQIILAMNYRISPSLWQVLSTFKMKWIGKIVHEFYVNWNFPLHFSLHRSFGREMCGHASTIVIWLNVP